MFVTVFDFVFYHTLHANDFIGFKGLKVAVADKLFKNITVEIVLGAILRQYNCE